MALLVPGTTELREGIPADDLGLLLRSAHELAQLAAMANGVLVLSAEELQAMIARP